MNKCEIVATPFDEVKQQYLSFIKNSDFSKKEFENFNKINNGALLYHWEEGGGINQFLVVDFDKDFNFFIKSEVFAKKIDFVSEDKKRLSFILEVLEKGNYYQSCERFAGHSNLYVLIVRGNSEIKVQFFSPFAHPDGVETSDMNIKSIQEIFKIMEQNYYRVLTGKSTKIYARFAKLKKPCEPCVNLCGLCD